MEKEENRNVDYVLGLLLLGQMQALESRKDEALKAWSKANSVIETNSFIAEKVPALAEVMVQVIESIQSKQNIAPEQKSLFSRFAEMAKLEEEVSADLPIQARIQEILAEYVFLEEN